MELEHGTAVVGEDCGVASRLGGDEVTEGELTTGDGEVLLRGRRHLDVDADTGAALVELPGRVQEPRTPAERRRTTGAAGQRHAALGEVGIGEPVEVGHDGDVAVLRVELREERVESGGHGRGVAQPVARAAESAQLDRAVRGGRVGGRPAALVEEGAGCLLGALDVGLVEGVDAEQAAGDRSRDLPQEQLGTQGAADAYLGRGVAGRLLGINPFDQPDVESAKKAARALLDQGTGSSTDPAATDGAIEIRTLGGSRDWLGDARTVPAALDALFAQLDREHGYVAVMAYLDRLADADLAECRVPLARRTERPTTFGWGPRFLHSTGQFHKGGPAVGVYLQITTAPKEDLAIPGREFTFGDFIASQAAGDAQVLAEHDRPVLQLHLTDHDAGLAQLREALLAGGRV